MANFNVIYKDFLPSQKVALLLIALGQRSSTEVMRILREEEIKKVSYWITQMKHVPPELTELVIKDFYNRLTKKTSLSSMGGKNYLMDILTGMMGEEKASSAVDSLITQEQYELFKILKKVDPKQLGAYLKKESPQAIAVMLAHVDSDRSGAILSALPQDSQIKVLLAMARLEESDPEIVTAMEKALTEDISSMTSGPGMKKTGGAQAVAKILNSMSASDNKFLMGEISEEDFELASDIKDLMFVFEDLILLEDKSLQVVMKEIEQSDLILSLKGANDTVKDKIFSNISKRQVESINDELAFMGPVKSSAVKQAQQSIVGVVRKLNEEGKLLIQSKGGGDDAIIN